MHFVSHSRNKRRQTPGIFTVISYRNGEKPAVYFKHIFSCFCFVLSCNSDLRRWGPCYDRAVASGNAYRLNHLMLHLLVTCCNHFLPSALGFSFRMMKPKPEPFIVNRPFFFLLRDENTGATLFIGRVTEP